MGAKLGAHIQILRRRQGITIRQVANQVGLSPSHLSLIERGQREISINTLYPLIRTLDGDFNQALRLLVLDAGIPEEVLSRPWS